MQGLRPQSPRAIVRATPVLTTPRANAPYCHLRASCEPDDPSWLSSYSLYAAPPPLRYLKNNSCTTPNNELGQSHARLPVSHTKSYSEAAWHMGLWFYYMRGCSDLHLNVGRTLAVRNRCEAAILLEQRASRLTLSHDTAIKRVAARLEKLRFGGNAREYAAVLQRARERLGVPNGSYAWLIRECAAGVYDDSQSECVNALRDQTTNYSRVPPPVRAYALANAAAHPALDEVSVPPLRKLVGTAKELDTIQFIEQPHWNSIVWAVEIWDVRFLQEQSIRESVFPPGRLPHDYKLSSALSRAQLSWPNGSNCEAGRNFDDCWSCRGSELERACTRAARCSRNQTKVAFEEHVRRPSLLHAEVVEVAGHNNMPSREIRAVPPDLTVSA